MIMDKGRTSPSTRLFDVNLLFPHRCLHALPAKQVNEIALRLASIPALAAGSSQSMLLAFMQERESSLSSEQQSTLEAIRLSLHLPQPWRDRLSHLLGECCMKEPCIDSREGAQHSVLHDSCLAALCKVDSTIFIKTREQRQRQREQMRVCGVFSAVSLACRSAQLDAGVTHHAAAV